MVGNRIELASETRESDVLNTGPCTEPPSKPRLGTIESAFSGRFFLPVLHAAILLFNIYYSQLLKNMPQIGDD